MILLDTNVVSEIARQTSARQVESWLDAQPSGTLHICTPVLAEIYYGIQRLPLSRRRSSLVEFVERALSEIFPGRILPFDAAAAEEYGLLVARRESQGRPIGIIDAQIAAIARSRRARLATRNTAHFDLLDLELVDPFGPA